MKGDSVRQMESKRYYEDGLNSVNHDLKIHDVRIHEVTEAISRIGVGGVSGHPITIDSLDVDDYNVEITMGIDLDLIEKMLLSQLMREFRKCEKLHVERRKWENNLLKFRTGIN